MKIIFTILFFLFIPGICSAMPDTAGIPASKELEPSEDERHFVFSSRSVETTRFNGSIGASLTILPQPLTEYPAPAPMIDIRWRLAFPMGLEGYGRLGSNIATSIVKGGLLYAADIGPAALGIGYSVSYIYGNLTFIDGFNTSQHRWLNQPMVCTSVQFDKVTLSARLELEFLTSLEQRIEDQVVASNANEVTGASLTFVLEQPFWHRTHVLLGVTFSNSTSPYQAWFLYNTFKDRLFSTEFFLGFIL